MRLRAVIAERKIELLKWWLLLREEYERSAGATGVSKHAGRDMVAELRRIVREPELLDLMYQGFPAGTQAAQGVRQGSGNGILDGEVFVCPEHGSSGVAAHGVALDLTNFSASFARSLLPCIASLFPPSSLDCPPLCAPSLHAHHRQDQARAMRRFAADWMMSSVVVGQHMRAVEGMVVVSRTSESKGVGTVLKDKSTMGIQWVCGVRAKETFEEEVWNTDGMAMDRSGDEVIVEAPVRIKLLITMEKFARSRTDTSSVMLIQGKACCGKSTLLARYVHQRESREAVAPGLEPVRESDGAVMHAYYFAAGHSASADYVLAYLAADIYSQIPSCEGPGEAPMHAAYAPASEYGLIHESQRRFASAVIHAALSGAHGISVLVMVRMLFAC